MHVEWDWSEASRDRKEVKGVEEIAKTALSNISTVDWKESKWLQILWAQGALPWLGCECRSKLLWTRWPIVEEKHQDQRCLFSVQRCPVSPPASTPTASWHIDLSRKNDYYPQKFFFVASINSILFHRPSHSLQVFWPRWRRLSKSRHHGQADRTGLIQMSLLCDRWSAPLCDSSRKPRRWTR